MRATLSRVYHRARYSIGFYPTLISMGYFAFAVIVVGLPRTFLWDFLEPMTSWVRLPKVWNAEVVLSTLITGIISFITLSFAMVMVVLSNISTTYSPKLILGLVTEKNHQVVLGNYIGAILYCLILLLTISDSRPHPFKDLLMILAAAMGTWCLVLFIYFIHKISTSVQINNIVEKIYSETEKQLLRSSEAQASAEQPPRISVDETILPRYPLPARRSGYLQQIDTAGLAKVAAENDLVIRVHPLLGDFVVRDSALMACTRAESEMDARVLDRIHDALTFFSGEKIELNVRYGFTQLMEVAVKALSPGINDPGTACICIDYLTDLFLLRNRLEPSEVHYDENGNPRLIVGRLDFETLFTICIGPIRRYGKGDLLVADKLLHCIGMLAYFDRRQRRHREFLNAQAAGVLEDIQGTSSIRGDVDFVEQRAMELKADLGGYFRLPGDAGGP